MFLLLVYNDIELAGIISRLTPADNNGEECGA
jgi:hypothetical protein